MGIIDLVKDYTSISNELGKNIAHKFLIERIYMGSCERKLKIPSQVAHLKSGDQSIPLDELNAKNVNLYKKLPKIVYEPNPNCLNNYQ